MVLVPADADNTKTVSLVNEVSVSPVMVKAPPAGVVEDSDRKYPVTPTASVPTILTVPLHTDIGWVSVGTATTNYSATVSHTLSAGNGQKQVYVWFKDAGNNVSSAFSNTITLAIADTTAPGSIAISLNSGAASTTSPTVTAAISGTDAVGVTGYFLSETNSLPDLSSFISVASATSFSLNVNFNLSSGAKITPCLKPKI